MTELVLHIGAHRTGTTSLQQFLRENAGLLEKSGIQVVCPPNTRTNRLSELKLLQPRAIISEENMLGIMEENISTGVLYPSASKYLDRHRLLVERASKIYLTVRNYHEWWESAVTFCARNGVAFPNKDLVRRISRLPRSWNDVVDDVLAAAPKAEIIVREFEWKRNTPKQHLHKLTRWPDWAETTLSRRVHNQRPSLADIAEALLKKEDFEGLSLLPKGDYYEMFTSQQIAELRRMYVEDISRLRERDDIQFWGELPSPQPGEARTSPPLGSTSEPKQVLLHIGKTGGSYLKSVLSDSALTNSQLVVGGHGDTLISTARSYGRSRKLGFLFRDPAERFVSGFNSRLRQGRPTYNVAWTAAEAAAFTFFHQPEDLAKALEARDERLRSAAIFAFKSIFHLKHDYQYFLHSAEALRYEHGKGNIIVCCETSKLESRFDKILVTLAAASGKRERIRHESLLSLESTLSVQGRENIKKHLSADYDIYDACRGIAQDLGFD